MRHYVRQGDAHKKTFERRELLDQGVSSMSESGMNRRQFLESSGQAAGVVVVAASGVTMLVDPKGAWAMTLEAIPAAQAQTLLQALRVIYPHESLGDQYYATVVAALDQDAAADPAVAGLLKDGIVELDQAYPVPFLELSRGYQQRALAALEPSGFFQAIRAKTIAVLYNDPLVWEAF
ncbi:MAG: hypothetical protein ACREH3_18825, partial [Geminicoccales bacterium]